MKLWLLMFATIFHKTAAHKMAANATMADNTNDDEFVTVAKVGSIAEGEGSSFQVGKRLVAVFNHQGQYLAIDDLCPHMGASLGAGHLDDDGNVTCPWHAWRFNACSGKWTDNPRLSVDTFEVRVVGDEIQVRLKQPAQPTE